MRIFTCIVALVLSVLTVSAKPITRDQALKRATAFMAEQRDFRMLAPVTSAQKLGPRRTAATATAIEPYYVFNKGTNEGFVIVSGDDQTIGVLGYTDNGTFDYEQLPPQLQDLLGVYAQQIEAIQTGAAVMKLPPKHPKVETFMDCKWSQGSPYNNLCPLDNNRRSVTGCVATAMAQILYYNREKSVTETQAAIPSYSTYTKGIQVAGIPAGSPIDWENMKDTYGTSSDLQKQAVAQLMLYCGVSVHMDYTNGSSGAQISEVVDACKKYFGYGNSVNMLSSNNYSENEWDKIVYTELAAGRPVYLGGYNTEAGHAFLTCGYNDLRYWVNWGWGGQSDGYYYLTNLTPGDGQGIGGSSDGYNAGRTCIIGLEPENFGEKAMSIKDAMVKTLCLSAWDADKDGKITYNEAASVTSLGDVFKGKNIQDFKELYYFTSITTIDDDAFNGCTSLTSLRMPKALKRVGARAFKDCAQLRQVSLPTSVSAIDEEAFSGCTLLSAFELPGELSKIEKGTFKDCQALTSINLPITVMSIADEAFAGCTHLTTFSVNTFHAADIQMGSAVFGNISLGSATLTVMQGTKSYFTAADQWKDFGNIVELRELSGGNFATMESGKTYYLYHVGTGRYLTMGEAWGTQAVVGTEPMRFKVNRSATMPEGTYYLTSPDTGKDGTRYLFRTTNDNNVGQGVQAAFVDGNALTANAYWNIQAVDEKTYTFQIPSNGTGYQEGKFWGIQTDHASNAASPTYGVYSDVDYASHQQGCQWHFVLYDEEVMNKYNESMILSNLLSMAQKDNVKHSDEQAVYDNLESTLEEIVAAQKSLRKRLKLVEFADPLARATCISLFDSDSNGELSIKEASEVSDLGYMFYFTNNTSLTSFDEFEYFTNAGIIYGNTFEGCTNLASVVLPEGLQTIYYRAFYNCKKLTKINIPAYVTEIGQFAFYGCTAIREVTVLNPDPSNISLGSNIFGGVPLAQCTLYVPAGSKELYAAAATWKNFGTIVEVRGLAQPKFSPIEVNKRGYIYNVGTRQVLGMGEAYGTQSVVGRTGRVYEWHNSSTMPEGQFYLYDPSNEKYVFRTLKDSKVGEGVKACFGDGPLSSNAYWHTTLVGENIYTLQVPESDADYVAGEYLGVDKNHTSNMASPTYGIYWDIKTQNKNIQWAFVAEEDMQAALQQNSIASQLKKMLAKAKEEGIEATAEQAVYDNTASTNNELQAALVSVREKLHLITFSDETMQQVCLSNWDSDDDGELTFEEAAAVTDIAELFRGQTKIKTMEELKYFTGLTAIPANAFRNSMSVQTIYIPASVKSIGDYAFLSCSLLRNLVLLNDQEMVPYGASSLNAQATVFVPKNVLDLYLNDADWKAKGCKIVEYTGVPVVTATASRIYGRNRATISVEVLGAPVVGEPATSCAEIEDPLLPVGTYPILVSQGTITALNVELREGVFTIEKAPLTITAKSYSRNVGEANPEFELTYKTLRNKETAEQALSKMPVITCEATIDSPGGYYDIVVSGAEAQNYDITYVNGVLTVVDALGVESLKANGQSAQPLYDMQGRKVVTSSPRRGIYVIGKRKVVVK